MAKEISGYVKLQIKGGQANPAPPVGPALGQRGINIMEFCKAFNEKTKSFMGKPVPVVITVILLLNHLQHHTLLRRQLNLREDQRNLVEL